MKLRSNNKKICGFKILKVVKKEPDGFIYKAIGKNGSELFVKIKGLQEIITGETLDEKSLNNFPISHEIIVSHPPCPVVLDTTEDREFPVSIHGNIHWFHLKSGVRKPGYWSTTAIQVAKKVIEGITKRSLRVLDLGCGCGVIGVMLGLVQKVDLVVFSDIDSRAIECTAANAARMNLSNFKLRTGDLFGEIKEVEKFDLIIFGPPFFPDTIKTGYEVADIGGPTGRELALKYAKNVNNYLSDVGLSIIYLADYVKYKPILNMLDSKGLQTKIENRDILYPYETKFDFPHCNEIIWKEELESFYNYRFGVHTINNRRFIGFKMIHLISQRILSKRNSVN